MEKIKYKNITRYYFDDVESVIVCGDIHGEFNQIINKICVQYDIRNSVIIIAGDCGFGFYNYGYYENINAKNRKRLKDYNNYIVMVRGNHDNPAYFTDKAINFSRFMTVPDYSVIEAAGKTILCVGGATSVDRTDRMNEEIKKFDKMHHYTGDEEFKPRYYWKNEAPVYKPELLEEICEMFVIDSVVTHTAPSFCEKIDKDGLSYWISKDDELEEDVKKEREVMDNIFDKLQELKQPVSNWMYGHFHQSWSSNINGIRFKMIDINELIELR